MSRKFERVVFEYTDRIKPGEVVLLEYTSQEPVHLLLQMVLRYAELREIPLIIVDVLDGLHLMRSKLMLAGVDTELIDKAPVMKVGGEVNAGDVILKVDEIVELSIFRNRFMEALRKIRERIGNRPFIRIVIGATELLQRMERDAMKREAFFAGVIRPLVGNPDTRGLVFLNRKRPTHVGLKEAEELSTRVLRTRMEQDRLFIRVVKSIHLEEYGAEISTDPCSLRDYLIRGGGE